MPEKVTSLNGLKVTSEYCSYKVSSCNLSYVEQSAKVLYLTVHSSGKTFPAGAVRAPLEGTLREKDEGGVAQREISGALPQTSAGIGLEAAAL